MAGEGGGGVSDGAPWLFGERTLRRQLSNMYAAMVASTANARLLRDTDPAAVRREDAEGGAAARYQLDEACSWLDEARIVCEPAAFDGAILGCARRAAAYLVAVRDAGASTACFDSWVFRKSAPQDDDAGAGQRTVISAVVPSLEACMSVRVPPDVAAKVSRGSYRIGPATPMPLTNRLHFVSGAGIAPLPGGAPSLADWDFLKASPSDLHALSDSIEMDGYCEMASVQDDSVRWRLGAPAILPGAVERLDDSSVAIRGLRGEDVFAVRQGGSPPEPDGLPNGGDVRRAVGAYGRFLVAVWYQPGMRGGGGSGSGKASAMRAPELLHYEACGRDEAALDDLIGHVRMRGRAWDADELRARYGMSYPTTASGAACLDVDGGAVKYRRARRGGGAGGGPAQEFFRAVDDMKAAWRRCRTGGGGGLPATPRGIVSEAGADAEALSAWMGRGTSANRTLLADLQHEFDRTGYWRGESDGDGAASGRGAIPHRAVSLERLGLLRRDGGVLSVTDRGRKALAASFRQDARRYASEKDCLYLPEIASRIPASVLLRHLRDSGDFERAEGPHGRNSLLWARKGADVAADLGRCRALLERHCRLVLECVRTANFEINARFVRAEMKKRGEDMACFHASHVLDQLVRAGRLEAAGGGNSWKYPLRGRILDTMRMDRARAWDIDGILGSAGVGRNDIKGTCGALAELAADGLIVGLEDGRWACRDEGIDEAGQRRQRAVRLAKGAALSMLRHRATGMDPVRLAEQVGGHLSSRFRDNPVRGLRQIARDAVSKLAEDGRIRESGGLLRHAA